VAAAAAVVVWRARAVALPTRQWDRCDGKTWRRSCARPDSCCCSPRTGDGGGGGDDDDGRRRT